MQATRGIAACLGLLLVAAASGCGRGDGFEMADAAGTVSYNGEPLVDAKVLFVPDTGLPAIGTTDSEGRFVWNTRGETGAVVGPGKVAVTAVEQLIVIEDREPTAEELEKMSRWLIPEQYGHVSTSGLTAEVVAGEKNEFSFELVGPPIERSRDTPPVPAPTPPGGPSESQMEA